MYFIGNQPRFCTRLLKGSADDEEGEEGQQCRIVLLPKFKDSGEVVLVNTKTLEVRVREFAI